jgi:transposase
MPSNKPRRRGSKNPPALNPNARPDAAGIDVGAKELVVALPPGRDPEGKDVRTFRSFTSGVEALRDWLLANRITTVALESTGNYWITAYDLLEAAGLEVFLVNARHVKGVSGKKTDVHDAQWLQQLHAAALLKKSFRPTQEIVPLRYLMRHRETLIEESSRQVQRMQKVLTEMNLKIQHVFSDVDGHSAQAIIDAILAGERDPLTLAKLRDRRCRSREADIVAALKGTYREEYLFVLRQCQTAWRQLEAAQTACEGQLAQLAAKIKTPVETPRPALAPGVRPKTTAHSAARVILDQAWQFYGVDLSLVPGMGVNALSVLMSEVGTRADLLQAFRSSEDFCSWQGLCPDNRISGGKILKAKTRKVLSRLARALRLAVFGLQRSTHKLGEFCRRMKGRLGKAEGVTAGAHKLARILYGMILHQTPYDEANAFQRSPANLARQRQHLQKLATELGYQLVPAA